MIIGITSNTRNGKKKISEFFNQLNIKYFDIDGTIKNDCVINKKNDDSLGAEFYDINKLDKNRLSKIALLELNKMGYLL